MIDAEAAEAYLASHLVWDHEPALSQEEQARLLELAKAIDKNGIAPGATGYIETYTSLSLAIAVLEGAEIKLAMCREMHEGDETEIYEHWKDAVGRWTSKVFELETGGSSSISGADSMALANTAVW